MNLENVHTFKNMVNLTSGASLTCHTAEYTVCMQHVELGLTFQPSGRKCGACALILMVLFVF